MAKGKGFLNSKGAAETVDRFLERDEEKQEETKKRRKPAPVLKPKKSTPARQEEPPVSGLFEAEEEPPAGFKRNPKFVEVKSERVQFVFQPSLLARFKAESKRRNTSMNDLMHRILKAALVKLEAETIEEE